jgi:hypothetical protein
MTLRLTIAVSDNPQTQPLKRGSVKPQTIELDTRFHRNLFYDEFDVAQMSIVGARADRRNEIGLVRIAGVFELRPSLAFVRH